MTLHTAQHKRHAHCLLRPEFSTLGRQNAWHLCQAGCIVISENPQGLVTRSVQPRSKECLLTCLSTAQLSSTTKVIN